MKVLDGIARNDLDDGLVEGYCHWGAVDNEVGRVVELELEFVTCCLLVDSECFLKKLKHQSDFQMEDICDLAAMIHCTAMELLELL